MLWLLLAVCLVGFFFAGCPCCGGYACIACTDTPTPDFDYQVEIAGISGGSGGCCTGYNATYVLPWVGPGAESCTWRLQQTDTACTSNTLTVAMGYQGTVSSSTIRPELAVSGTTIFIRWTTAAQAGWWECELVSGEVANLQSSAGTCTATGSTATITSLAP